MMSHFDINYTNYDVDVHKCKTSEKKDGWSRKASWIPSHAPESARNAQAECTLPMNPEGLEARGNVGKPRRPKRDNIFTAVVQYKYGNFSQILPLPVNKGCM